MRSIDPYNDICYDYRLSYSVITIGIISLCINFIFGIITCIRSCDNNREPRNNSLANNGQHYASAPTYNNV